MSELNSKANFFRYILDWINDNPGKAIGLVIGFLMSVILLVLGIWKTILVGIFMGIGYLLGRSKDEKISIIDEINRIFKRGYRE
ncbi:MAG: DUF2273 domain-containing protein [Spirochaetes bacterium]|nr:DUF2273 domain-containing protein [Spirochaetota bacterium]